MASKHGCLCLCEHLLSPRPFACDRLTTNLRLQVSEKLEREVESPVLICLVSPHVQLPDC